MITNTYEQALISDYILSNILRDVIEEIETGDWLYFSRTETFESISGLPIVVKVTVFENFSGVFQFSCPIEYFATEDYDEALEALRNGLAF